MAAAEDEEVALRDGSMPSSTTGSTAASAARYIGEVEVRHTGEGQVEIDVELPCEPAAGLGAALRAAARGLVGLRP